MSNYRRLLGYTRPYFKRFLVALVGMIIYALATGAVAMI
ncbi:unnamed protein product, partial [marine sediment metagenome]